MYAAEVLRYAATEDTSPEAFARALDAADRLRGPEGTVEELAAAIEAAVPGAWALLQQAGLERIAQNARGEVLDNVMPAHDRSVELTPAGVVLDGVADPAAEAEA